ncbi:PAS domain-containing protein [Coriobacteriia bacterium Es71-Z0120]|uniref:PAS domain-containing protein n=1 Tax=Parvivirga hydrogeniphila TaxID=2939460 RepID=UPI002260BFF4|nr:PAS domain-containing protein [Parvivirga hydrogeniphila]MCL4078058.1 PAS domain-containing protein [Parvivirga hydrogeniphila]
MRDYSPIDAISEILADVPDLVFVFTPDGRYLYVNNAAAAFLGDDPVQVIGSHWRDLAYPAEVMEPLQAWIEQVAQTCEAARYTHTTSEQRGSRLMDVSLTPLKCEDGDVYGVLLIAHDVTDHVKGAS